MLTTYYDTISVSGNKYVSKSYWPTITGETVAKNYWIAKTDMSLYNTNALLTTKFGLY
jgi:hypothetical protein